MIKAILSVFITIVMMINPQFLDLLDIGKMPDKSKKIDMSKFEKVWWDEFEGTEIDSSKWGPSWWVTERKGGYWHEDMVSVRDGNLVIRAEYLEEPLENKYYEQWSFQKDGAAQISRLLFEEATDINFFVGRAVNPAHQNPDLPINFHIKMNLVTELSQCLRKMGKRIKVSYF
jgi:hypothetical protein